MKKEVKKSNIYKPTNSGTQKVTGQPKKEGTLRVKKTGNK